MTDDQYTYLLERIEEIRKAFPNEDLRGHRAYHEKMIRGYMEKEKIKYEIIKNLIWGAIVVTIAAVAGFYGLLR